MQDDRKNVEIVDHVPMDLVDGFPVCKIGFNREEFAKVLEMKPRKGDIFLNTYPKCGTTWTQYIMWEIVNDGAPPPNTNKLMFQEIPFLEFTGMGAAERLKDPRMFKLHLPFRLNPWSPEAKYITVMRNPFDCCVSFFHHFNEMDMYPLNMKLKFDTFVEDFVNGDIPFGSYFEHISSFYEKRNEPNVLFLSFEDMKKDSKKTILDIAEFMSPAYRSKLEGDSELMERILKHTSFQYLKENVDMRLLRTQALFEKLGAAYFDVSSDPVTRSNDEMFYTCNFYRKGTVGSSKTELSDEQWDMIDQAIDEKVKDPELRKLMRKTKSTF